VCHYMTNISGITPELLHDGVNLRLVQNCMKRILNNNVLVGMDSQNDLKSLLYSHEMDFARMYRNILETPIFNLVCFRQSPMLV
jgi:hypothetical protein